MRKLSLMLAALFALAAAPAFAQTPAPTEPAPGAPGPAAVPAVVVPMQLPPAVHAFVGRGSELAALDALLPATDQADQADQARGHCMVLEGVVASRAERQRARSAAVTERLRERPGAPKRVECRVLRQSRSRARAPYSSGRPYRVHFQLD